MQTILKNTINNICDSTKPRIENKKGRKNKLFDIAQLNVFNENNGLLGHLKVKHFQWHVADLVSVIDLKKILTPGSPTTATNPPVLLASLPREST